jgi:hypothetical protein
MSRLASFGRPWVSFDASNKQHREWFTQFERSGTWGRCPVRFIVTEEHGDLVSLMRSKMLEHYIKREFKD